MNFSAISRARSSFASACGSRPDERVAPDGRERRAGGGLARREGLARPRRVGLVEQRQVEQPFAGIVDDVDREAAAAVPAGRALEVDRQAQLRDPAGRLRPLRGRRPRGSPCGPRRRSAGTASSGCGSSRARVMRPSAEAASTGSRAPGDEVVDERRQEHRLAGARQAGDAEPKAAAGEIVADASGRRGPPRTQDRRRTTRRGPRVKPAAPI